MKRISPEEITAILHQQGMCKATTIKDALEEMKSRYRAVADAQLQSCEKELEEINQTKHNIRHLVVTNEEYIIFNNVLKEKLDQAKQQTAREIFKIFEHQAKELMNVWAITKSDYESLKSRYLKEE